MAKYGAKYLRWAPFADENADEDEKSLPKYGASMSLGALMEVTDAPEFSEATIDGDDKIDESVSEFSKCPIDLKTTELPMDAASELYGANLSEDGELANGGDDVAPLGGLAFLISKRIKGQPKHQGVFYPKTQAVPQGETFTTKGSSITLNGDLVKLTALLPANRKWRIKSKLFSTESEAKAWVDGKLPPNGSAAAAAEPAGTETTG